MNNKGNSVGKWLRIIAFVASMSYAFSGIESKDVSRLLFAIWLIIGVVLITLLLKFGDD